LPSGVVSAQQRDEDDAQVDTATARVIAARRRVQAAQGTLTRPSYLRNTPIRAALPQRFRNKLPARTDVAVTQQEVRDAQAAQTETLNYLVINSPMAGNTRL